MTSRDSEAKLMMHRVLDTFGNDFESFRVQKMVWSYGQAVEPLQGEPDSPRGQFVRERFEARTELLKAKFTDTGDYVKKLVAMLEEDPMNNECWAELGEMYAGTGNYEQAVQAWRHVLLIRPEAYNAWARVGELRHLQAVTMQGGVDGASKNLTEAVQCMCKAVDLCPAYVRGWSGVYIFATKLSQWPKADVAKYTELKEKARLKLESMDDVFAKKIVSM